MASIRLSKKKLNQMVYELVEETYDAQIENPAMKDKSDALIDKIVEFQEEMLGKLHGAESKKDLSGFSTQIEEKGYNLFQDVMNLHV